MIATLALGDLTTPITVAEARQSIYDVLSVIGVSTTNWRSGAVVRTIITAVAVMIASLSVLIAFIAGSGFLALSKGSWLTLVARYVYNVERITATFATGYVTLTNAGGGVYTFDPDELTLRATGGQAYHNTETFTLNAASSITIAVRADEIGTNSNAATGAVTEAVGLPTVVTAANAAAIVGRDDEPDEDLRLRCSEKLGSLSPNGPSDAFGFAARGAVRTDGSTIGVNRVRPVADGTTTLVVYIATASGGVSGVVGDLNTDLGAVDEAIQTQVAPIPVLVDVRTATTKAVNFDYTIEMYNTAGVTAAQAEGYISAALAALFAAQPIGGNRALGSSSGFLFRSDIVGAIHNAASPAGRLPIYSVSVPGADTSLTVGQVPIIGAVVGTININVPVGL